MGILDIISRVQRTKFVVNQMEVIIELWKSVSASFTSMQAVFSE